MVPAKVSMPEGKFDFVMIADTIGQMVQPVSREVKKIIWALPNRKRSCIYKAGGHMNHKSANPLSRQFNARLTVEEYENLRRKAFDEKMSISSYVRALIQTALSFGVTVDKNNA